MNLSQVNLFVKDFSAMLGFYRDTLGLDIKDLDPGPPSIPLVNWVSLRAGETSIELFDSQTFWDSGLLDGANRQAAQLCFLVDDVQRERARLESAGVECDPIVSEDWGAYSSFRDPEGNWLQMFAMHAQTS
ncbi:MAG TPA: VOC family protein [Acidimicrobiales bacterium]|nr:VOC family protein [Acidimicrobiales bacterium]